MSCGHPLLVGRADCSEESLLRLIEQPVHLSYTSRLRKQPAFHSHRSWEDSPLSRVSWAGWEGNLCPRVSHPFSSHWCRLRRQAAGQSYKLREQLTCQTPLQWLRWRLPVQGPLYWPRWKHSFQSPHSACVVLPAHGSYLRVHGMTTAPSTMKHMHAMDFCSWCSLSDNTTV